MNIKNILQKVVSFNNLTRDEAEFMMQLILDGEATQAQIATFLTALRMKSESLEEIIGCAQVLKRYASQVSPSIENYIDFVGTGGDGTNTFNISTTSCFVAAAAGLPIAKNGNRAISSKSGSVDLLEKLGINIRLSAPQVERCVNETGLGFMFAQMLFKMGEVSVARKEMGIRTIFNMLGPLSNPSNAKSQFIGVFTKRLTDPFANAMRTLGVTRAIVVSGSDGMDEVTTTGETFVSEIKEGRVLNYTVKPEDFGFERVLPEELAGGTPEENAMITRDILMGTQGAKRDIVVLNSAFALYAGNQVQTVKEGVKLAQESIDSGAAYKKLNEVIEYTNSFVE